MPDKLDEAKELEIRQRDEALQRARRRNPEPPQLIIDGEVLCIDCEEPIEPKRLASKPDAARCIDCQRIHELKEKQVPHG